MTLASAPPVALHTASARERPFWRKATLLLAAALTIMAGTTISPSLPAIETAFADVPNVALLSRMVLTLPALFGALCAPLIGALADRIGRRWLLVGSIALYGFSGISGLFVDSLVALLVGRAFLGVATGGIMTLVTALVGDYFAGAARERYLGLQQAFTGLGGVAFVIGGGMLAELHWRVPFAVYALAFALIPAVIAFLGEPRHLAESLAGKAVARIAANESQINWPPVGALCLLCFLINIAFYVIPSQLPFHMRALDLGSPTSAGLALGMHNLIMAGAALSCGRLRARFAIPAIFAIGLALMACGFALAAAAGTMGLVLLAMIIAGAGFAIVVPNLFSAAIAVASSSTRGRVAGIVTASMFFGHFASPLASQPWIASFGYSRAFRDVALLLALLAGVSLLTGLIVRSRR